MTKHVIDSGSTHGNARMTRYTDLEKRERMHGRHPAVEAVERRARPEASGARSKAYMKIESRPE